MSTKAWISIIASVVFIGILTFLGVWLYTNFSKVQQGIGGTGLYTQEDIDNAYRDGYDTALTNEAEYLAQIEAYRDQVTNLTDTIAQLNSGSKDLENQIATLTASNNSKNNTISELRAEILTLQNSIASLTSQVGNLTSTNIGLSSDLFALNNQLATIQGQALGYTTTINRLNSLVTYLSSIVIDWENRTEFLATYYVNGQIWDIQVIDHINTAVTVPTAPVGNFTFVGWSLDGYTVIDPTQIPIVTDTEFQAVINVTATFLLDGATHDVQTIRQNTAPETPIAPNGNFTFVGWSLNGSDVITLLTISQNTTYIAVYTYTVTFVNQGETISTQEISRGNFAIAPTSPTRNYYTFGGWSINGTSANDVASTPITSVTIYTALWNINSYTVTFISDGSTVKTQTVNHGGYAVAPSNPIIANTTFIGWSVDGSSVVNVATKTITSNTTFTALHTCQITYRDTNGDETTETILKNTYVTLPSLSSVVDVIWSWYANGIKINGQSYLVTTNVTLACCIDVSEGNILHVIDRSSYLMTYTVSNMPYGGFGAGPSLNAIKGISFNSVGVVYRYVQNGVEKFVSHTLPKTNNGRVWVDAGFLEIGYYCYSTVSTSSEIIHNLRFNYDKAFLESQNITEIHLAWVWFIE